MDYLKELAKRIERKRLEPPPKLTPQEQEEKVIRGYFAGVMVMLVLLMGAMPVFAAGGDPLATINNLSDFIFGAIKAIGIIMLGFGIVQIGLSLKSHDASQRANGLMTFFGGIIIAFSKNILDLILG